MVSGVEGGYPTKWFEAYDRIAQFDPMIGMAFAKLFPKEVVEFQMDDSGKFSLTFEGIKEGELTIVRKGKARKGTLIFSRTITGHVDKKERTMTIDKGVKGSAKLGVKGSVAKIVGSERYLTVVGKLLGRHAVQSISIDELVSFGMEGQPGELKSDFKWKKK